MISYLKLIEYNHSVSRIPEDNWKKFKYGRGSLQIIDEVKQYTFDEVCENLKDVLSNWFLNFVIL